MPDAIFVADTSEERQAHFRDGGVALRAQYHRRPGMHLLDYERKMEGVRIALLPEPSKAAPLPPVAA